LAINQLGIQSFSVMNHKTKSYNNFLHPQICLEYNFHRFLFSNTTKSAQYCSISQNHPKTKFCLPNNFPQILSSVMVFLSLISLWALILLLLCFFLFLELFLLKIPNLRNSQILFCLYFQKGIVDLRLQQKFTKYPIRCPTYCYQSCPTYCPTSCKNYYKK